MIAKKTGGEMVKGGIYWSVRAGEFIAVPTEGGRLPGGPQDRYVRAPLPVVLIVGPLMGLAFAIFLPLSGLLVLGSFLADRMRGALSSGRVAAAHAAGARLQPGVSYLEPRAHDGPGEGDSRSAIHEGKLVDLAKEIAEKRWQDR